MGWAALAWTLGLSAAFPARAEVLWRGDFECGDLSQWSKAQAVEQGRLQVVPEPTAGSRYALRAEVRAGDNPIGASGNRNELVYASYEPEGCERVYRWQTRWPADYPSADTWQLFTQWHHEGPNGSPPLELYVRGERIALNVQSAQVWSTPLVRERWYDFVLRVKWSPDPEVGFVELYVDRQLVLPRLHVATQYPGQVNYLKQGLYRDARIEETGVVFHDGMTVATRLEDVLEPGMAVDGEGQIFDERTVGCAAASGPAAPAVLLAGVAFAWRRRTRPGRGPTPRPRP